MSIEVQVPSAGNPTEGSELEQAADALAAMGLKAENEIKNKDQCQEIALHSSQESGDCDKQPKTERKENLHPNQAHCSACMKIIQNPISEGHGIVHGHVGQFKMLIPWVNDAENGGVLCSRCYQRNWRLNKQRNSSAEPKGSEEAPVEPYRCLCGMTFHSSQLKAAHCRLCQKYRELADQEQRQEGKASSSKPGSRDFCQKRPRPSSDQTSRRASEPAEKKEHIDVIFSTPPPAKIRSMGSTPVSCFVTPQKEKTISISPQSCAEKCGKSAESSITQKLEVAQLLLSARLLGQVDIIQYTNLAKVIANTTDKALLDEISQVVLNLALKPYLYSSQIVGSPSTKLSCFEEEDKQFPSLTLLPHYMLHSMK